MDINYIAFVIGTDILHAELAGTECDVSWEICKFLAKMFKAWDEKYDLKMSEYEALWEWYKYRVEAVKEIVSTMRGW